jgi:hypothetical protein
MTGRRRQGNGVVCDCKAFFEAYDAAFLPHTAVPAEIKAAEDLVLKILGDRVQARADGKAVPDATKLTDAEKKAVKLLSDAQLKLYRDPKLTGKAKGGIDADCVRDCFIRFNNGELRRDPATKITNPATGTPYKYPSGSDVTTNGEPNSTFTFYFAEFAFLAIDLGFDADAWLLIARGQVASEEAFNAAYKPRATTGRSGLDRDYTYAKGKELTEKQKAKLREDYKDLKPDDLRKKHDGSIKAAKDAADFVAALPGTRRLAVALADVRIQSSIGRQWSVTIALDGAPTTLSLRPRAKDATLRLDLPPLLEREIAPDASARMAIPVSIDMLEDDPLFDDRGVAAATLLIDGAEGETIVGGLVKASGGDAPGSATLDFRFRWQVETVA